MTETSGERWWRPDEVRDRDGPETTPDRADTDPVDVRTPASGERDQPATDDPRWGEQKGALREGFHPGAYDQHHQWDARERAIADRLAQDGAAVHAREPRDGIVVSDPDAMVRRSPGDEGVITEFATLDANSPETIAKDVTYGGSQLAQHGGGDLVIDGRPVGLTAQHAEAGHTEVLEDRDRSGRAGPLPDAVHYILADNSILAKRY
jgi:hypothetical protein